MTKSLSSIKNQDERRKVAEKRANSKSGGLSYLAAVDYLARMRSKKSPTVEVTEE